jgi:hypothetical protein
LAVLAEYAVSTAPLPSVEQIDRLADWSMVRFAS